MATKKKDFYMHYSKKRPRRYKASSMCSTARRRAKRDCREFNLTVDWIYNKIIEQKDCCAISGIPFNHTGGLTFDSASIDRIDNTKGYTTNNCHIILFDINAFKGQHKIEDFINMCGVIYEKNRELFNGGTSNGRSILNE